MNCSCSSGFVLRTVPEDLFTDLCIISGIRNKTPFHCVNRYSDERFDCLFASFVYSCQSYRCEEQLDVWQVVTHHVQILMWLVQMWERQSVHFIFWTPRQAVIGGQFVHYYRNAMGKSADQNPGNGEPILNTTTTQGTQWQGYNRK